MLRDANYVRPWLLLLLSLVLAIFLPGSIAAQTAAVAASSNSASVIKAEEIRLYANAHPYLDDSLPDLRKSVPELKQLIPATSQSPLPDLLARAAAQLDEPLSKCPNLVSEEVVTETQPLLRTMQDPCPGMGACISNNSQQFNYILLIDRGNGSRPLLKEYRTTLDGKTVPQSDIPHSQGFASSWLILSAFNEQESHFRYLGEQKLDGHLTYVVGFSQIPGAIQNPGYLLRGERSIPMLLQGIAWLSEADYRIVRLRTDLLEPQTEVGYKKQTATIEFQTANISALHLKLWLPNSATIETVIDGQLRREQHRYSKYRLYEAKSKIILSPTK